MKAKTQLFIEKGSLTLITIVHLIIGCPWIMLTIHDLLDGSYFKFPVSLAAVLLSFAPYYWFATRWWHPREDRLRERIKVEEGNG